ncbi:MAG: DUF4301 family protein [Muribaculaceae bacterium]|nr:DUF4301 family protein [Muribaculaceae bacterium]
MLRPEDLKELEAKGIAPEQIEAQLERFRTGFPYLKILDAARPGQGITVLTPEEEESARQRWNKYLADGGEVTKFVPASGAASRMFKALFEFVDGDATVPAEGSDVARLIEGTARLPFIKELEDTTSRLYGASVEELKAAGRYKELIAAIIKPEGMNYGGLPKGLLKFHTYPEGSRTPLEEQLTEGAQTAANSHGVVRLHFTVSANHRKLFEEKLAEAVPQTEARTGVKFDISLSEQKPSTDTVAVNPDNTLFIEDGHMLFRPGGHGALIENLNDIDSAVVFIKNIDNVVPDSKREATVRYKQVLGGYLMQLHDTIEHYLTLLATGQYTRGTLQEMLKFLHFTFSMTDRSIDGMNDTEVAIYLHGKLSRPLRVCGMVRNEGEPGGGPFIAYNPDGSASLQILESHQIDKTREDYARMLATATHFNPVDLVCYTKRHDGTPFNLLEHVDPATGFISDKSSHGRPLRALELPGLWNGAMSDWNTAFVEVPIATFNPVKTVNDLLRPAHQG